ncbi:MAG TPA: Hsp20/alpha crystallin family protein [Candidatus Deferrimicrobium sp.]|nr:Hsp20/alpha crystallin family protein [Candidatus Deferrimicrobium sp.]
MKKNDPFSEIEIRKNFSSGISTHVDWEPRTNIIEAGDLMVIEVELPGVKKDDVSILLDGENDLIIKGTKLQPRIEAPQVTHHLFEREFGNFTKKIAFEFPLNTSGIISTMENGVLTIKLPRKKIRKFSVDIK